jgi:hypothetical protein
MWTSAAQWGEFGDSPCFEAGEATRKVQGRNMADTVSWWAFREGVYQRLKVLLTHILQPPFTLTNAGNRRGIWGDFPTLSWLLPALGRVL